MEKTPRAQHNFRLSPATIAEIDDLMKEFALESRADVIRFVVRRIHNEVLYDGILPKRNPRKSSPKS